MQEIANIALFVVLSFSLIFFAASGLFFDIISQTWLNKYGIDIPAIVVNIQHYEIWGIYGYRIVFKRVTAIGKDPYTQESRKYKTNIFSSTIPIIGQPIYVKVNKQYPWHHYIQT